MISPDPFGLHPPSLLARRTRSLHLPTSVAHTADFLRAFHSPPFPLERQPRPNFSQLRRGASRNPRGASLNRISPQLGGVPAPDLCGFRLPPRPDFFAGLSLAVPTAPSPPLAGLHSAAALPPQTPPRPYFPQPRRGASRNPRGASLNRISPQLGGGAKNFFGSRKKGCHLQAEEGRSHDTMEV